MRKAVCFVVLVFGLVAAPGVAVACGGLIGPNGAVNLERTATLAAYLNGVEHYVTAFKYQGGGGKFGSIVPLPAMPSKVERGGDWTLQRLQQETQPQVAFATAGKSAGGATEARAVEVYKTRIDALDITVLKGAARSVGLWARDHGFRLPPDAPEVLDFYGKRSPYFMAAVFDADAAKERGQQIGDGTPIHLTIPISSPWVPLRILGLGKQPDERVEADVYLLTGRAPNLLPFPGLGGYTLERQVPASDSLLADLRSDRGMEWLPKSGMTLTHLVLDTRARDVRYDLAINANGGAPSRMRAGLPPLPTPPPTPNPTPIPPTPDPTLMPVESVFAAPVREKSEPPWTAPLALAFVLVPLAGVGAYAFSRRARA